MKANRKKTASSEAAPKGAAIARVVPVLPCPKEADIPPALQCDGAHSILVEAWRENLEWAKAFRQPLYAESDKRIGSLAESWKRHAELSGMIQLYKLLDNSGYRSFNGHCLDIVEHERQYVEQVIKSLSGVA
jgi:hypothetical protein